MPTPSERQHNILKQNNNKKGKLILDNTLTQCRRKIYVIALVLATANY